MTAATRLDQEIAREGGAQVVVKRRVRRPSDGEPILRRLAYIAAEEIPEVDEDFDDELVEGVIGRAALAVLYGDSNSGKTFLAIHITAAIARNVSCLGCNTAPGLVLYLATEAAQSVLIRLRAYRKHHGAPARGVVVVQSPVNLFDGDADVTAILAAIQEIESHYGEKVVLVVGDTLARIAAGADENGGKDMGVVIRHADAIRSATGATFLWVHHCGKDAARGMRGWSGMRAAIDTEIEVTADESTGVRTLEITKQRDLPGKGTRIGFRLEPVPLGRNRWGARRDSCVVVPADAPAKAPKRSGGRPSEISGAITEFLLQRGTGCRKVDLVKHFDGRFSRGAVYKDIDKMVETGTLLDCAGVVALPLDARGPT